MTLEIYDRLGNTTCEADETIVLTHEQRERGRIRTHAKSGSEVRIFLERGQPLAVNEILSSQCGKKIRVQGAVEPVVCASCDDWRTFSRACYHLGNRHVKLQVGDRWLRIQPDHVLEDMLRLLGLDLNHEDAVFEPESGAYKHANHHH